MSGENQQSSSFSYDVLEWALHAVSQRQGTDGGFTTLSAPAGNFDQAVACETVFECALVSSVLHHIESDGAARTVEKCQQYLERQFTSEGSLNYWPAGSLYRERLLYPDDMDDIACAMTSFFATAEVSERRAAQFVKLLIATESVPGGPYRSWVVAKDDADPYWQDIDVVVNANIAYALSLLGVVMPSLDEWLGDMIVQDGIHSKYYPRGVSVSYFIARSYQGPHAQLLAQRITALRRPEGVWATPVQTAQAVSSLVRLGHYDDIPEQAIALLMEEAKHPKPEAIWEDPAPHGSLGAAGSVALTAAFIAEALWLHRVNKPEELGDRERPALPAIVERRLESLPLPMLKDAVRVELLKLYSSSSAEIIGAVPGVVAAALGDEVTPSITVMQHASAASVWGWLAYTIYDDFMDRDAAVAAELLPVAHWAVRAMLDEFSVVASVAPRFAERIEPTLARIDAANYWEVSQARAICDGKKVHFKYLPNYDALRQLAERSIGHALAGLAVLDSLEAAEADVVQLERYFHHYLIARQLNDDAHDWEDDLRQGQLSAVVVWSLIDYGVVPHIGGSLQLTEIMSDLQQSVWRQTMPKVSAAIERHCALARSALASIECLAHVSPLERMLRPLEQSAQEAMRQRGQVLGFIAEF